VWDAESAVVTVRALWKETHETKWAVHVPGIPEDRAEFNAFDQWTAGLLRKAAELFAAEAQTTPELYYTAASSPLIKTEKRLRRKRVGLWKKATLDVSLGAGKLHSKVIGSGCLEPK